MKAFVKVTRSDMAHNRGELFYSVCRTDHEGRLWNVLNPEEYPWAWGFSDIANALRIVDNVNADDDTGISTTDLARELCERERARKICPKCDAVIENPLLAPSEPERCASCAD